MELQPYLQQQVDRIEVTLSKLLPDTSVFPETIHKSMRYSALGGGKRLRSILSLEACKAMGGKEEQALKFASAIEMIHSYTLIHDDLPCMDDDDYRRGKPSNHKVFGEGIAILAGDALLTYSFQVLASLVKDGFDSGQVLRLIEEVSFACGSEGLIGGQVVDLESEGKKIGRDTLDYLHENKTSKLFIAALRGGAIIGGANDKQLASITSYGENFGLAFQITDDILDVTGDPAKLGKETGADVRQEKSTFVSLYGLEQAKSMAEHCVGLCSRAADSLPQNNEFFRKIAQFVLSREF